MAADCMAEAVAVFIERMELQTPSAQQDENLRRELWEWSKEHLSPVTENSGQRLKKIFEVSASLVEYCYPLAQHDTRLQMAVGCSLVVDADSQDAQFRQQFNRFQYNLYRGTVQPNPWLRMFAEFIHGFVDHFGAMDPRMGTLGGNAWANFVEASYTEDTIEANGLPPHFRHVSASMTTNDCCPSGFPYAFRCESGAAPAFILPIFKPGEQSEVPWEYWMPSMGGLMTFTNLVNDLWSASKELLDGESSGYFNLQTQARRQANAERRIDRGQDGCDHWTYRDTICEAMDALREAMDEMDRAFIQFPRYDEPLGRGSTMLTPLDPVVR
jgi:hypothetical protein